MPRYFPLSSQNVPWPFRLWHSLKGKIVSGRETCSERQFPRVLELTEPRSVEVHK